MIIRVNTWLHTTDFDPDTGHDMGIVKSGSDDLKKVSKFSLRISCLITQNDLKDPIQRYQDPSSINVSKKFESLKLFKFINEKGQNTWNSCNHIHNKRARQVAVGYRPKCGVKSGSLEKVGNNVQPKDDVNKKVNNLKGCLL